MSHFFGNSILRNRILFDKSGDAGGGGGGASEKSPDLAKELAAEREARTKLEERLAKLEGGKGASGDEDEGDDLKEKARKQMELDQKQSSEAKALKSALEFNLKSEEFLKNNQSLLPKEVSDIFKAAEKEKYSNEVEKTAAIKSSIIQSFFSVQANMDLLTPTVKANLEEYLALTKSGKQEKAQGIFDTIFEPALKMLREMKKADALQKGHGYATNSEEAFREKLIKSSKKHYLGEK